MKRRMEGSQPRTKVPRMSVVVTVARIFRRMSPWSCRTTAVQRLPSPPCRCLDGGEGEGTDGSG